MKKIYLLFTMMLMASMTFAQTFKVTVRGNEVKTGDTVMINLPEYPVNWVIPNVVATYNLDPEIKIIADTDLNITISAHDRIQDGVLQNCAFGQCVPVTEEMTVASSNGDIKAGVTEAGIHLTYGSNNPGADLQRAFNVTIATEGMAYVFDVQFNIGATSVSAVKADNNNAAAYSVSGAKVNVESLPNGRLYIKNGKKYIK